MDRSERLCIVDIKPAASFGMLPDYAPASQPKPDLDKYIRASKVFRRMKPKAKLIQRRIKLAWNSEVLI
jgi:hypothetical protein